ncbi:large conductance mechanosensitive channel protein MscL [bacterium CPR1]|nr:large conductance mechanosensitive channel protein MscL [bacterium CPR1]
MWKEFRDFLNRGNVVDMAVGVIIGAAFGRIVDSLVKDVLMPPIGLVLGGVDFTNLFLTLGDASYPTLAEAQKAGAATINYGVFLNTLIQFLIVALAVFMMVKSVEKMRRQKPVEPPPPDTRDCPFCLSTISKNATRCPQCTSELEKAA